MDQWALLCFQFNSGKGTLIFLAFNENIDEFFLQNLLLFDRSDFDSLLPSTRNQMRNSRRLTFSTRASVGMFLTLHFLWTLITWSSFFQLLFCQFKPNLIAISSNFLTFLCLRPNKCKLESPWLLPSAGTTLRLAPRRPHSQSRSSFQLLGPHRPWRWWRRPAFLRKSSETLRWICWCQLSVFPIPLKTHKETKKIRRIESFLILSSFRLWN